MGGPIPSPALAASPTRAGRRYPALLAGRVVEQAVFGGVSLLLAARLGTVAFAPIAVLFVVNAAAVTLSDYGVGLAVLRCAPGERVRARARTSMRRWNLAIVVVGSAAAAIVGGDVGLLVASSALIWWASAEAFVQKAGAINCGAGERAALAEIAGAVAFAVPVVTLGFGSAALTAVACAFPAKHLVEALVARHGVTHFADDGTAPDLPALWGTQALAFCVSNVDYLVVATVLGASAFSVYTVAYRFAVAIPSTVAYVASRTAVADLSAVADAETRQERYTAYVRRLFGVGVAAVGVMAVGACLLPVVLGGEWNAVAPSVVVLAFAVPWRMVFGQAGALALSVRRTGYVVRWEAVQLAVFAGGFVAAAAFGYGAFVTTVALAWILSVTLFERGAAARAGIAGWSVLRRLAVVGAVAVVATGIGFTP